jgi:hypothetical protein
MAEIAEGKQWNGNVNQWNRILIQWNKIVNQWIANRKPVDWKRKAVEWKCKPVDFVIPGDAGDGRIRRNKKPNIEDNERRTRIQSPPHEEVGAGADVHARPQSGLSLPNPEKLDQA